MKRLDLIIDALSRSVPVVWTDKEQADRHMEALAAARELGLDYEPDVTFIGEGKTEQEPVCDKDPMGCYSIRCQLGKVCKNTAPPKREWQGLTQDEIEEIYTGNTRDNGMCNGLSIAFEVQNKLREKNEL